MSETRYTIVYRSAHAEVLLGPLGFHAQCMDGCDWASGLEHAQFKARASADKHDQEHTGRLNAADRDALMQRHVKAARTPVSDATNAELLAELEYRNIHVVRVNGDHDYEPA